MNGKRKGSAGEREFCDWLFSRWELEIKPERNLAQTRDGGLDILLPPFGFEIKRCERIQLAQWWSQCTSAASEVDLMPVVAFRQNRKDWEFLISAKHIGLDYGWLHMNSRTFLRWSKKMIE